MRALQGPGAVDCRACGKTELMVPNLEAWEFYCQYPSLIRMGLDGSYVDYPSALTLLARGCWPQPELMLQKLEAIRQGFTQKTQKRCKKTKSK